MFTDGQIVFEILLVDSAKGAQEVTHRRPQAFNRIGMNLSNAISILISSPFLDAMTDRAMRPVKVCISLPLVGVAAGVAPRVVMAVGAQRSPIRMLPHPQATVPTLASDGPHHRPPIIFIGTVP